MFDRKNLLANVKEEKPKVSKDRKVGKIEKSNCGARGHVTEGIFCLLLRQGQKWDKKLEVQLFLVRLLVPLAGWPSFCLVLEALALGLTVGLTIGKAKLIGVEVAVRLSEWSW